MSPVVQRMLTVMHQHQRLSNTTGVIAGFVGAISVLYGEVASHFAPHGWHGVAVMMHVEEKPLMLRLEPVIASIALTLAISAALLRFISWCLERRQEPVEAGNDARAT